jgi:hypothetical protein
MAGSKRLTISLQVVAALSAALAAWLAWGYFRLELEVSFADDQTAIFEEMRLQAWQGDAAAAAGCLRYVVGYYTSGTKQRAGSRLDRMVERERARAVKQIITRLRTLTGQDLGEEPDVWIQRFGS